MNDAGGLPAADGDVMPISNQSAAEVGPWDDHRGGGLLPDETPFRFFLNLDRPIDDLLHRHGIHPADERISAALSALLANAMYAEAQGSSCVSYSRDRDHYGEIARAVPLRPDFYNLNTMTAAVEILEAAGLIEHWKTAPSPQARHRSRFRATPDLLRSLELRCANFIFSAGPQIVLRDRNGQLLPVPNSRAISRMRRDIEAQNEFLDRFVTLGLPVVTRQDTRREIGPAW